jgi:hypothetical protein
MYEVDNNTVSLLHFDDGIKDETGKVWTANGGAAVSTVQSKLGISSLYLNNAANEQSKYITLPRSADLEFGSGDYCIDFWYYPVSFESSWYSQQCLIEHWGSKGSYGWILLLNKVSESTASLEVQVSTTGNEIIHLIPTSANCDITLNKWQHICICRNAGVTKVFVDGKMKYSVMDTNKYNFPQVPICVGRNLDEIVTGGGVNGYIDELRISNVARWISDFTPDQAKVLLRITMNDSSEREYQATSSEADKFIAWCNRTVDTGTAYYVFDKVVGSQTSKEYLFFEKIISFEVFKL